MIQDVKDQEKQVQQMQVVHKEDKLSAMTHLHLNATDIPINK